MPSFLKSFQYRNRRLDGLFDGGFAVFGDFVGVFRAVVDAARAADAAAGAAHAFDEVVFKFVGIIKPQCLVTFCKAIADDWVGGELIGWDIVFFQRLCDRFREPAAAREDASEIAGVVEHGAFEGGNVDVFGVEQCLQLFEGDDGINKFPNAAQFVLFGDAWANEHRFAARVHLFQHLAELRHWAEVVADLWHNLWIILMNVVDKTRAAGAGQKPFFDEFLSFEIGDHVGTPGSFQDRMEAEIADAGDSLLGADIRHGVVLAGNGWRDNGIDVVVFVVVAFADQANHIGDIALVDDGSKWALVHTLAAGNAFIVVDDGASADRVAGQSTGFAGFNAGTDAFDDGAVWAAGGTASAGNALGVVDRGAMVWSNTDGVFWAVVHAAVGQAAAAVVGDGHPVQRAFVAGDGNNIDDGRLFRATAAGQLDVFIGNGALFVNAAAHGRFAVIRKELLADIHHAEGVQFSVESQLGDGCQCFIFLQLNVGIEHIIHGIHSSIFCYSLKLFVRKFLY